MRALKALKKRKLSSSVVNEVDPTRTLHDTTKEPDVLPRAKRSRESEIIDESNNKDGASSYILIDDDAPPASVSPKFFFFILFSFI